MVEYHRHSDAAAATGSETINVAIVGVGGAGSNVLDRITLDRTMDASLICMHTDVRVLSHAMAPVKLQLGSELMRGIGAGGDPDLGREAALFSRDAIRQALQDQQIIFICTGLGGGTGSGAAPVIAEIAKSTGALVLVVATMPFSFEGRRRINQAEEALELLQKRADALILFENNRMGELILPKDGIQKAFSAADQLISQCLRAVSTITSTPGLVRLGMDDLTAALAASNGRCLFGYGEAKGQHRGAEALKRALKSPLIDQGRLLNHAKNLLVHVAGGENLTLVEVEGIMKSIGRHVPDQTQILFGVAVDSKLGDSVAVTLISSLGLEVLQAAPPVTLTQRKPERHAPPVNEPAPVPPELPSAEDDFEDTPVFSGGFDDEDEGEPPPLARSDDSGGLLNAVLSVPQAKPRAERPRRETAPATEPARAARDSAADLFAALRAEPAGSAAETDAPESRAAREDPREATLPDMIQMEEPEESPAPPFDEPMEQDEPQVVAPMPETTRVPVVRERRRAPEPEPELEKESESEMEPLDDEAPLLAYETGDEPPFEAPPPPELQPAARKLVVTPRQLEHHKPQPRSSDDMFGSADEQRGRFKDTEPSLEDGKDLDVPTWMRLRRKRG